MTESGAAMKAPPPKPMIAIPVAIPGWSGNHLIRVETGRNVAEAESDAADDAAAKINDPQLWMETPIAPR